MNFVRVKKNALQSHWRLGNKTAFELRRSISGRRQRLGLAVESLGDIRGMKIESRLRMRIGWRFFSPTCIGATCDRLPLQAAIWVIGPLGRAGFVLKYRSF